MGFPKDKVFINIDRYGNTSAASVPIALDEARKAGRCGKGDWIIMVAFGAGLTWAAATVSCRFPFTPETYALAPGIGDSNDTTFPVRECSGQPHGVQRQAVGARRPCRSAGFPHAHVPPPAIPHPNRCLPRIQRAAQPRDAFVLRRSIAS